MEGYRAKALLDGLVDARPICESLGIRGRRRSARALRANGRRSNLLIRGLAIVRGPTAMSISPAHGS